MVKATDQATNAAKSSETNSSGGYSITNLEPGIYKALMEKSGFKIVSFDETSLTVARALVMPRLRVKSPVDVKSRLFLRPRTDWRS
jgi:hypothetical protein